MYLLDSDILRALDGRASPAVNNWVQNELDETKIYLCAAVLMEQRKGIERKRKTDAATAAQIENTLKAILTRFPERVLSIDGAVADEWGRLLALKEKNIVDRSIAATAKVHGMVVVTTNTKHYKQCGVRVLDPSKANPQITDP